MDDDELRIWGGDEELHTLAEIAFPHSLGLFYTAFTFFTGFKPNSGEYKLMGLAPYGEPKYVERLLEHVIDLREDGSFRLDMRYFQLLVGAHHDNASHGGASRRPQEDAGDADHPARDGYCPLMPGSRRGGHVAHGPHGT